MAAILHIIITVTFH